MKAVISWFLMIAVLIGAGFGALTYVKKTNANHAYEIALNDIKLDFERRSHGMAFLEADPYQREIGVLLTSYFSELRKLKKKFPEQYDVEREYKIGEEKVAKGHMTEVQKSARDERIEITLDLFNKMKSGQYRPTLTGVDKGFRFDVYEFAPDKVGSETRIKIAYVHWGAFGPVNYHEIIINLLNKSEDGKPVEVDQVMGGGPPSLQITPEKWVKEFIPGVEIGFYDMPQFPQRAITGDFSFTYGIRTIGGSEMMAEIKFDKIEIEDSWKVPEGQVWEAQERFADEAELKAAGAKPGQDK